MEDQQDNPLLSILTTLILLTTHILQHQTKPHLQTTMTGPIMVPTGPTMGPIIPTMVSPTTLLLQNRQVY